MPPLPQMAPFRFGETQWDDYARDVQTAIYDASRAQIQSSQTVGEASAGQLQDLKFEMHWGFTLLRDQMETHLRQLQEISGQLDRIAENTGFPRRTEAREAFGEGLRRIRQGLLAKGIEKLLEAETINDVDFLLQLQLGKIYLYGRDADEDIRDLDRAEQHLQLAVQYTAAAARDLGPRAHPFEAEARYHLAVVAYLQGSAIRQVDAAGSNEYLQRALQVVESSPAPDRSHRFFLARCHALQGNVQESFKILKDLADEDRSIIALATTEPDFMRFTRNCQK